MFAWLSEVFVFLRESLCVGLVLMHKVLARVDKDVFKDGVLRRLVYCLRLIVPLSSVLCGVSSDLRMFQIFTLLVCCEARSRDDMSDGF